MGELMEVAVGFNAHERTEKSPESTANETTNPLVFSTWPAHYTGYAIPVLICNNVVE
jgi:hypothetical protein